MNTNERIYKVGTKKIKAFENSVPKYVEHSGYWFLDGYRYIKTKGTYSTSSLQHCCFKIEPKLIEE